MARLCFFAENGVFAALWKENEKETKKYRKQTIKNWKICLDKVEKRWYTILVILFDEGVFRYEEERTPFG